MATSTSALTNSNLFQSTGGKIGISTTTATTIFEVWGTTTLRGLTLGREASNYIFPEATGTRESALILKSDGRLRFESLSTNYYGTTSIATNYVATNTLTVNYYSTSSIVTNYLSTSSASTNYISTTTYLGVLSTTTSFSAGYLSLATSTSALTNSNLFQSTGGKIGISTTTPTTVLEVWGTTTARGLIVGREASNYLNGLAMLIFGVVPGPLMDLCLSSIQASL